MLSDNPQLNERKQNMPSFIISHQSTLLSPYSFIVSFFLICLAFHEWYRPFCVRWCFISMAQNWKKMRGNVEFCSLRKKCLNQHSQMLSIFRLKVPNCAWLTERFRIHSFFRMNITKIGAFSMCLIFLGRAKILYVFENEMYYLHFFSL